MIDTTVMAYAISKGFTAIEHKGIPLLKYTFTNFNGTIMYYLNDNSRLIKNILFNANVDGVYYSMLVKFKSHEAPFFTDKEWQRDLFTCLHNTIRHKDAEYTNAMGYEFDMTIL